MPDDNAAQSLSERDIALFSNQTPSVTTSGGSQTTSAVGKLFRFEAFQRAYGRGEATSVWQSQVLPKICQYLDLPKGWDSYNGQPLKSETGMFVLKILNSVMTPQTPIPQVIPMPDGGVQLEWHENQFDLELYVAAPYECELSFHDHISGVVDSMPLSDDFSIFAKQVRRLMETQGAVIARNA